MDKTEIINTMVDASLYTISGEEFIRRIIQAGVTSYKINIETYQLTFKGENSAQATYGGSNEKYAPVIISLVRKNNQDPLMVQVLKKVKVQSYEVFLPDMSMRYYDDTGKAMDLSLLSF